MPASLKLIIFGEIDILETLSNHREDDGHTERRESTAESGVHTPNSVFANTWMKKHEKNYIALTLLSLKFTQMNARI